MERNKGDAETWAVFEDDARSCLQIVEESLLVLEDSPGETGEIDRLYRALHTLKGSSAFLGLEAMGRLAHEAEDVVDLVRDEILAVDECMVDVLLSALDALRTFLSESQGGELPVHRDAAEPIRERLRQLAEGTQASRDAQSDPSRGLTTSSLLASARDSQETVLQALRNGDSEAAAAVLQTLRDKSEMLSIDRVVAALDRVSEAVGQGHGAMLALVWQLAIDEIVNVDEAGLVIFDDDEDPELNPASERMELFRFGALQLFDELTQSVPNETTGQVVVPVALACEICFGAELMAEPQLLEVLAPLRNATEDVLLATKELAELQATIDAYLKSSGSPDEAISEVLPSSPSPGESVTSEQPVTALAKPTSTEAEAKKNSERDAASKMLRVDASKVENLMALAGEIALATGAIFSHKELVLEEAEGMQDLVERVEGLIRELQDSTAGLGLVPVGTVFSRMKRLIRDLNHKTEKDLTLRITGESTEIDKVLVDALHDPLLHLIRNSADHGIESAEERRAAGKPATSVIHLSARHQSDSVVVSVRDDGAGMNRDRILAKAISKGLVRPEAAEALSDSEVWDFIFAPGFSTATSISGISGRGVGMDVVKMTVQSLRGRISIRSIAGKGTSIDLHMPLTLAFLEGMVVRIQNYLYVIPVNAVNRVFSVRADDIVKMSSDGEELVRIGEELVPALDLQRFYKESTQERNLVGSLVVVVRSAAGKYAIPIDELVGHEQVTMKPLEGFLQDIRAGAACGLLRSGGVAIALDCERLHEFKHTSA